MVEIINKTSYNNLRLIQEYITNSRFNKVSEIIDSLVTKIAKHDDEEAKSRAYHEITGWLFSDNHFNNRAYINSVFYRYYNLIGYLFDNDVSQLQAYLFSHLRYYRTRAIPALFLKSHIDNSENLPILQNNNLYKELREAEKKLYAKLKKHDGMKYAYDTALLDMLCNCISDLSLKQGVDILSSVLSTEEVALINDRLKEKLDICFYIEDTSDRTRQNTKSYSDFMQNEDRTLIIVESFDKIEITKHHYIFTTSNKSINGICKKTQKLSRSGLFNDIEITFNIYKCGGEGSTIKDFYSQLRKAGSQENVKKMLESFKIPLILLDDEKIMLADIYYRAGYFSRAFNIVKKMPLINPTVSYRILTNIIKLTNNNSLQKKCQLCIEKNNLMVEGFSKELSDVLNDEIDRFMTLDKKAPDIWL